MTNRSYLPISGSAKTLALLAIAAASCLQNAEALIAVPRDFPLEMTNGDQATENDRLASLVSFYRNDVVLLANPEEAFDKSIREAAGTPAFREKLKSLATAGGAPLSADSLGAAAAALVRQNPADAPVIMASAMEILGETSKKISVDDRYLVARGAISGLPFELRDRPSLIAQIVGISALDLKQNASTGLVRRLREFAIYDLPVGEMDFKGGLASAPPTGDADVPLTPTQSAFALTLDEALVNAGILSPYAASPQFLAMANNFATSQLDETFFSGDQGVITQGAVFGPGSAGSAGGSGTTGNQVGSGDSRSSNRSSTQVVSDPPPAS